MPHTPQANGLAEATVKKLIDHRILSTTTKGVARWKVAAAKDQKEVASERRECQLEGVATGKVAVARAEAGQGTARGCHGHQT